MPLFEQLIGTQTGLVITFLLTAFVVVVVGIRLSIYGDALGDRTGLGSGLIGLIFLAAVTSLPELVVSLTSVIKNSNLQQGADLAVGNMLGSNIFNLLILALMALLLPRFFTAANLKKSHTGELVYGLGLLFIFSVAFWGASSVLVPGLQCSWLTLLLPIAYGFILWLEHRKQKKNTGNMGKDPKEQALTHLSATHFYGVLTLLCILIIGGGILLSILGSRMALPVTQGGFGLEASLVGTLFLAVSTSLPELAISFSSIRLGFLDMAIGNVLGSNMFNLLIIFASDIAMRKDNLLQKASGEHGVSIVSIFLLTLLAAILIKAKSKKKIRMVAVIMVVVYLVSFLISAIFGPDFMALH
jgi:cation:H+ antiporter